MSARDRAIDTKLQRLFDDHFFAKELDLNTILGMYRRGRLALEAGKTDGDALTAMREYVMEAACK